MQLDVTVLDKKGVPVRGLTQADFALLEDGKPQAIEGFTAVDVPDRVVTGPAWADRVTPDVTTNEIDNARIFVLVIDDGFGMGGVIRDNLLRLKHAVDPKAIADMKRTVELFISLLGPEDLAGIVFTGTTAKYSQNLTGDRAKLVKAVQAYPDNDSTLFMDPGRPPAGVKPIQPCLAYKEIIRLVNAVVDQLASLPDRRKSIVYFGGQMPWASLPQSDECGTYWMWREVFAAAQQGSVTINPVQTAGLGLGSTDEYLTVADNTGGHAVVNTNDFAPGVRRIFTENSSYYLLAYQPTRDIADGTFRRISVTVKGRPDAEVVTKRNYWAPRQRPADAPEPPPPSEQIKALSGLIPDSRLALRVTAAPFASGRAGVMPWRSASPASVCRPREQVELLIRCLPGRFEAGDDQMIRSQPGARGPRDVALRGAGAHRRRQARSVPPAGVGSQHRQRRPRQRVRGCRRTGLPQRQTLPVRRRPQQRIGRHPNGAGPPAP
jgi:VWFA-related protein